MKRTITYFVFSLLSVFVLGQGLKNYGAYIKVGSGAYLKVTGASGNVLNSTQGGYTGSFIVDGTTVISGNLTLNPKSITTINGTFTVTGNILVKSDATGTASLIDYGTLSVTGTSYGEIYIPLNSRYYYVASPVAGAVAGSFNAVAGADYLYNRNTASSAWVRITNPAQVLTGMIGFATKQSVAPRTLTLSGTLNTGTKNASLVNSGDRWNLVANPYPSAIDWGTDNSPVNGWTRTNILSTIYIKHGTNFATWNPSGDGIGLNDGTRFIPAMQSFWVRTTGAPTLQMTNLVRVHNTTVLLKESNIISYNLRIKAVRADFSDETLIRFCNEAENDFDKFDSEKYFTTERETPQLYTPLNNEDMAINSFVDFEETFSIPLGFKSDKPGNITLNFSEFESFPMGSVIYLKDVFNNTVTNITLNPVYTFYTDIVNSTSRFTLYFSKENSHLDPEEFKPEGTAIVENGIMTRVKLYSQKNILYVKTSRDLEGILKVYNILGSEILSQPYHGSSQQYEMNTNSGYYVVKFITSQNAVSQKVYLE